MVEQRGEQGSGTALPSQAHVVVIGAGGLGCQVLPRVARMAVSRLTIIDGDRVEARNLPHQSLYDEMDIGHPKSTTAAGWMRQIMPAGEVVPHDVFVDAANVKDLISGAQVVVEGVDDLHAKQLIDRACAELGIPLVSGAVHQRQGQVIVLHAAGADKSLSREQLFQGRPTDQQDGCDMRQVPEALLEEVGRRMASHARDILYGKPVANGVIDLLKGTEWISIAPPR